MSRCGIRIFCMLVFVLSVSAARCRAFYEAVPIQLSLWAPIQIFSEERDVVGLRLSIYGANANVAGLDVGLWNQTYDNQIGLQVGGLNTVDSQMAGVQFGIANLVGEGLIGWQGGFYNLVNGEVRGVQTGPMNMGMMAVHGLQIGVVNYAQDMSGLQIGLFNATQVMYGVQIGIVNIISDKETLPILPLINAAF